MSKKSKFNSTPNNRRYDSSQMQISSDLGKFLAHRLLDGFVPQRPGDKSSPLITGSNYTPTDAENRIYNLDVSKHDRDTFSRYGSDNQGILDALFNQLLHYDRSKDEFQREDFQNLLDWYKLLNQRDYDEQRTDEQRDYDERWYYEQLNEIRKYDSPQQQLARLMATGMSREKAIQLLSESPSSSPVSSSSPISGQQPAPGVSSANGTQEQLQKVQMALSAFSTLMSFGVSSVAAGATSSLQYAQSVAQQQANNAQQSSARFNSLVHRAQRNGLISKDLSFDDAISALSSISSDDDSQISEFVKSGAIDDLLATPGAYSIASANYNTRFGNTNQLLQDEFLRNQVRLSNIDVTKGSAELETFLADNQRYNQYAPYLHQKDMIQIQDDIAFLSESTTPQQLKYRLQQMKNHNKTLAYLAMVDSMQAENAFTMYKDQPFVQSAVTVAAIMDKLGLSGIVGEISRVVTYGSDLLVHMMDSDYQSDQNEESSSLEEESSSASELAKECEPEVNLIRRAIRFFVRSIGEQIKSEIK